MSSLVFSKWLKVGVIWKIEKLEIGEYLNETSLNRLLELLFLYFLWLSLYFTIEALLFLANRDLPEFRSLGPRFYALAVGFDEIVHSRFVLEINHLYFVDQPPLSAVFDGDLVVAVDEIFLEQVFV